MFKEINTISNPPVAPTFVWDGDCKFCKWWKDKWEHRLHGKVIFKKYQDVNLEFPDIPVKEFQKASRLIDENGHVYSGPDSAYKVQQYLGNAKWHVWYKNLKWFKSFSNIAYNHIAKNRSFYYKVTIFLFGSDPIKPKIYWFYYLLLIILLVLLL